MKNLSIFEPQIEKHYADKKTCILFFKVQNKFIKPADFEKQLENFYRNKIVFLYQIAVTLEGVTIIVKEN